MLHGEVVGGVKIITSSMVKDVRNSYVLEDHTAMEGITMDDRIYGYYI